VAKLRVCGYAGRDRTYDLAPKIFIGGEVGTT